VARPVLAVGPGSVGQDLRCDARPSSTTSQRGARLEFTGPPGRSDCPQLGVAQGGVGLVDPAPAFRPLVCERRAVSATFFRGRRRLSSPCSGIERVEVGAPSADRGGGGPAILRATIPLLSPRRYTNLARWSAQQHLTSRSSRSGRHSTWLASRRVVRRRDRRGFLVQAARVSAEIQAPPSFCRDVC